MAVQDQSDSMFAGNRHVLQWDGILDTDAGGGALIDLTGRLVKFSLTRKGKDGPLLTPILDFRSDVGTQLVIVNPITGSPHVTMELVAADTLTLAPKETVYYCELEVMESSGADPVVVATLDLTIKPNVVNA
jgi:hypothetical protein